MVAWIYFGWMITLPCAGILVRFTLLVLAAKYFRYE
jgi:hypothetical protein